jgi:cytochrome c oxidase assembly protein Cox11
VSVAAASTGLALARRRHRRRRVLIEAGSVMLAVILLIWSLIPVYNMFLIALDRKKVKSSSPAISGRPSRRLTPSASS